MIKNTKKIAIWIFAAMVLLSLGTSINAGWGNPLTITGFITGLAGFCVNNEPAFDSSGPFNAVETVPFSYDLNVTDPTQSLHSWYDNSTFFNINPTTGEFSFTIPDTWDNDMYGIHPVLITFDDGIGCLNSIVNTTIFINVTWLNHPPNITDYNPKQNITLSEEQELDFNISFRDIDNYNNVSYDDNNLSVYWYVDGNLVKSEINVSPENFSSYTYTPNYSDSGQHVIYVYVNDSELTEMVSWVVNVTDVYIDVNITQPQNGTSLLLYDNYTIFADISTFENRTAYNCTAKLNIYNKSIFDIRAWEGETYTHFIPSIGPNSNVTEKWDIWTYWIGTTDINVTAECEVGGWTFDAKYLISVNASEEFQDLMLPEGYYYNEPAVKPAYGNYLYEFNITFRNLTTHSSRIIGCHVNESNCYDSGLPGCRQIFVNKTTLYGIAFYNETVTYKIQDSDIINSTLGGSTDNWIPWRIEKCGMYELNMTPIYEQNVTWRIHTHPNPWTTGDIANALNAKSAENMFVQNTIKSDDQGDVAFSVTKYGGTKVELICNDYRDNPDESDSLADCSDPECFGVTFSCLPKQEFENTSLYYSPSGSHGTLASVIPPGDMASNSSSANTFNTKAEYTMHSMPNGTLKLRLRKWGLSKTATFFIDNLPDIKTVDKVSPGDEAGEGLMLYYLDKNGDPYYSDHLPNSRTYQNRIALRSYLAGGTEIQNLDTTLNITFADPSSINMSEGHVVEIKINYVEDLTPYEEYMNITLYFDDPSYGAPPRWNSTNEREDDIWIQGAGWHPCNDTKNADFDYLNCNGNEALCFDQSSYDCYDEDCDMQQGPYAWNDYTGQNTSGQCGFFNESQTWQMCFDGYNNDWATEDITWGHANTGLTLVDCRDIDCDQVSNGIWACEYNIERTCNDTYDNDMYNMKDCELSAGGTVDDAEYDCAEFCRNNNSVFDESGVVCDDDIDNDWDLWYRTDWSSSAGPNDYAYNNTYGAGIDCGWITDHPDEGCNFTYMSSGYRCEMWRETTCNDSFDNDFDRGRGQPDPGWNAPAYQSTFNQTYDESSDYDDYDCQYMPLTPSSEALNESWCFDDIDNDLDAYYWNSSWFVNDTTGRDCADGDCLWKTDPLNINRTCIPYEYNESDPFFDGLPTPDLYCKNGYDDDVDGPMDCFDSDCNKKFNLCYACPATENVSWDSCADKFDNDYGLNTDCADPDCIGYLGDYDHHVCTAAGGENNSLMCSDGFDNDADGNADCADSDCTGIGPCSFELCSDDEDNDGDGLIDCMDSGCSSDPGCDLATSMGGSYTPPAKTSDVFGNVNVEWDSRVRKGHNYTINLVKSSGYNFANIYIGRLTGTAIPVNAGLIGHEYSLTGPNASLFETSNYNEVGSKGQIEILDQVPGTGTGGFNLTIHIPTNRTLQDSFEYYHTIDGIPSLGNMLDAIILDDIQPVVQTIVSEPGIKDELDYDGSVWVGAKVTDENNGDYNDGTIDRCYYEISGPGYYVSGEDDTDCRFEFDNIIDDGNYTLIMSARDDTGNYADNETRTYSIDLKPDYVEGSFNLTDRYYKTSENISINAEFLTDDASSISRCELWYKTSTGTPVFVENISASSSGDILNCSGILTVPAADNMYEVWVNVIDSEGDAEKSGSETFYVCNDGGSNGTGTNGEVWSCLFADMNEDGTIDICEQKEIMMGLRKHANPDPVWRTDEFLNYTITYINRGYGNATNITIRENYSGYADFVNATPYPDVGNDTWFIGNLSQNENGTIDITVRKSTTLVNGTQIINIVNISYYNSTNDSTTLGIEQNTTVIGNTPPIFTHDLPRHHKIKRPRGNAGGPCIDLGFDLDDYTFDPDIPYGDELSYDFRIEHSPQKADIIITPEGRVKVCPRRNGAVHVRFNVTDKFGGWNISSKILIVITKEKPRTGGGYQGCIEDWECGQWSRCGDDGVRYRTCRDRNKCKSEEHKPREIELCDERLPGSCFDGQRNFEEAGIDCGGLCEQDCCHNGYHDANLGEEGVDCGGPCKKKCPKKEKPSGLFRHIEMLGIFVSLLILMVIILTPKAIRTILGDKRDYDEYMEELRKKEKQNPDSITKKYRKAISEVKEPKNSKSSKSKNRRNKIKNSMHGKKQS